MSTPIFGYVHLLGYFFPVVVGAKVYGQVSRGTKLLVILTFVALLNTSAQFVLSLWKIKNYFVSDYFRIFEVSLLCGVFWLSMTRERIRKILASLGFMFALVWLGDFVLTDGHEHLNSRMAMISRLFLLVMALIVLYTEVRDSRAKLTERSTFWVAGAVVIYTSGSFVVLAFSTTLLALGRAFFDAAWHVNWFLLIVSNLMYTKGMLCKAQP
jgi:hypothetical protein